MRLIALCLAFIALSTTSAFAAPKYLNYRSAYHPGTIEVHHGERALYFITDSTHAIRYPVAVPKKGMEWSGAARIDGKYLRPDWSAPDVVRRDHPELPRVIRGGDPKNPMGEAALTLDRDQLAIHGTAKHMRGSIGTAASYGCIRMLNEDILDLFQRVQRGTPVVMIR